MLVMKAKSGDPLAQHELGLRYLMGGKNFSADTLKAAYWIRKAAEQNLTPARYNLGILLNNGWGVPWSPFEAYKDFQYAAQHGMREAQYVYGLLLTGNLVVARNYREAYRWITMSADSGYAPAKEVLAEFEKRGITATINTQHERDTVHTNHSATPTTNTSTLSSLQPVYIDFSSDSVYEPDDETLLKEALLEHRTNDEKSNTALDSNTAVEEIVATTIQLIRTAAEAGSPEALTLMGRWYETGRMMKNEVLASVYYLRAIRNNSPWAPMLLWKLIQKDNYFGRLKAGVSNNDPAAKFVWADLVAFGFDRQLTEAQVLHLLEAAAGQQLNEAVVELGLFYYSGKWVPQDREKGKLLLKRAADAGNREAQVRLWMIELGARESVASASLVDSLRRASNDGSVLAQAMLGYCYQKGIGVAQSIPWSVHFYRNATQRGCEAAYNALKEMYGEIRPSDPEFQITE